ncbi:MAG TPA: PspC domain-containing protein [Streptosporangiaceae bacterium]
MNGTNGHKQLIRPRTGRIVAGVCAGLADYIGVDANLVRLAFAILTIFGIAPGVLAYVIAWLVIPEEGESSSIAESYLKRNGKSG